MPRRNRPEEALHKTIWSLYLFQYRNCFLMFHVPNGGHRSGLEGAMFKAMGVVPGVADFVGLCGGTFFAIELKDKKGRLSAAQEEFRDRVAEHGGLWFECRGANGFLEIAKSLLLGLKGGTNETDTRDCRRENDADDQGRNAAEP